MQVRTEPIFFWSFESGNAFDEHAQPYIDPQLQEGTTPLAKIMDGKFTRSFRNFKYDEVSEDHLGGARVMMNGKYKLLIEAESSNPPIIELFDITVDPGEANNLIDEHPDVVSSMQQELADWQLSVLNSLTGADY